MQNRASDEKLEKLLDSMKTNRVAIKGKVSFSAALQSLRICDLKCVIQWVPTGLIEHEMSSIYRSSLNQYRKSVCRL